MSRPHGTVRLKAGHVQPVWAGHPWIYAQAIEKTEGGPSRGDEVRVLDPRGNFIGRGFYSPGSAITVRLLTRRDDTVIGGVFFEKSLERALARRVETEIATNETTGYRLCHAEGDGLPGLIVDRFGDAAVIQFLTAGMKQREQEVLSALKAVIAPKTIIDRTPERIAKLENFERGEGIIDGAPITELSFKERDLKFRISLDLAQKTGFYFDQRDVRTRIAQLAKGRRILDAFGYVGAFSLHALRGGAKDATVIDDSLLACEAGMECARANRLDANIHFIREDARKFLQTAHGQFDLVILDPPRLAMSRKDRDQALVHYAKLADLGCRAVRPDGFLLFCSCSAAVDMRSLTRALSAGALKANVFATVHERFYQAPDHPVQAAFDEGLYLKCILARISPR